MQPVIVPRADHTISRKQIDPDALKVLYRLKQAGHVAYLVGGGVRDLLLGRRPKDFDISTSAHPNEVKRLFRNCRLIGRRFRLAHILFGGGKVIEVATFRKKSDEEPDQQDDLLVRRENTFGTPEEDAERRDFTINGLFYDIATFSVIDYVGGLRDLEERAIRTIGDPLVRLREDPVRMLRAVKFAARLGFQIAPEDLAAIRRFSDDLLRTAPERLLLEVGRLLGGGSAVAAFHVLEESGVLATIAPELGAYLERRGPGARDDPFWRDLQGLDRLVTARRESGAAEVGLPVLLGAMVTAVVHDALGVSDPPPRPVEFRRGYGFAAGLEIAGLDFASRPSAVGSEAADDAEELPGEPVDRDDAVAEEEEETVPAEEEARDGDGEVEADSPAGEEGRAAASRPRRQMPVFRPGDPAARVSELLAPLVIRLSLPRRDTEQFLQIVAAQRRLRLPGRRHGRETALARKRYFADALLLLEAHVLGTREGEAELRAWRALAEREGGNVEPDVRGRGADGRHRGRRRRRGGRGQRGEAPEASTRETAQAQPEAPPASEDHETRLRRKAEAQQKLREAAYEAQPILLTHQLARTRRGDPSLTPWTAPEPGTAPVEDRARRRRRRGGRRRSEGPRSSD